MRIQRLQSSCVPEPRAVTQSPARPLPAAGHSIPAPSPKLLHLSGNPLLVPVSWTLHQDSAQTATPLSGPPSPTWLHSPRLLSTWLQGKELSKHEQQPPRLSAIVVESGLSYLQEIVYACLPSHRALPSGQRPVCGFW